mgnify:CR=1 FL=1
MSDSIKLMYNTEISIICKKMWKKDGFRVAYNFLIGTTLHFHECSPFWVGIFITLNKENYHV